ncbi:MAG: hypothetical protein AB7O80_27570, partial [Acetobacteraceae bacterium]
MRAPRSRILCLALSGLLLAAPLAPTWAQGRPQQGTQPSASVSPWPHTMTGPNGSVTVYQPQAISWTDHRTLTARAAVEITQKGAETPIVGTLDLQVTTAVDPAANLVRLSDPRLMGSHFPMLDTGAAMRMEEKIRAALPGIALKSVPLQAVLLSLKGTETAHPVAVNNDPPAMFYSARPASLVVFDGEPVLAPIGGGLSYAVNTNWPVFKDGGTWYLLNGTTWLSAPAFGGPYAPVGRLPASFNAIPNDQNFADVRKAMPAKAPQGPVPAIFVSTRPAEIIVTDGPPKFVPVPATGLQQVTNASSDLFFDPTKGQFYFLTSGRWFSAAALDGPWTFATGNLPPDFALIDPQGPQGHVLVSVPHSAQAQAAVLKAQIPQTGTLKRSEAKLTVAYAGGAPQFAPIPGTSIRYAVNTNVQVLEVNGRFYACFQGAWFVSAAPTGPWALAESVPQAIYTIPPSSPMYPVTYVTVQAYDPATVTYAYTAGYMMGFVTAGVLVFGTGYYYPPYIYPGRVPGYFPYPYTYAGRVWYNGATGAWARGGAVYGPYGSARGAAYYNPNNGAWARGGAIYGPYGGAGAWS